MNKKSQTVSKSLYYIVVIFLVAITVVVLTVILGINTLRQSKIAPDLEEFILTQRFLNSPNCFTPQDEDTGTYKSMVIDWEKFNSATLEKCFETTNIKTISFRFALHNLDTGEENVEEDMTTKNWAGTARTQKKYRVKILKEDKLYNGILAIEVKNAR